MRIAIIGTGWGARVQVPAFRSAGLEIVGLAASNVEKTRAEAARLGVPAFAGWRELLDTDADVISIVTPPATHREMALAALAAGKHVLCEKPTALDAAEAAAMAEAAAARPGQLALIDHELRFHPVFQAARAAMAEIGPVRHVASSVVGPSRADASRPWTWWSDRAQGGGIWGAIGSHQLDTLRWLGGEISAIRASLHTFVAERPFEGGARPVTSDDAALAHVRFAGGGLGAITISMVGATAEKDTLTIHGEDGALRIEGGQLFRAGRGGEWIDQTPAHTVAIPEGIAGLFPVGTVYLGHALRAHGSGDGAALATAATFADGLRIQQLLDAGRRSDAEQGGWVAV